MSTNRPDHQPVGNRPHDFTTGSEPRRPIMPADVWKDREVAQAFLTERSLIIPDRQRQLEVLLRVIRWQCPQPRRILDLGCGDAILLAALLEVYTDARGVAVDFSPLMLEQARDRLAKFGPRVDTLEA